MGSGLGEVLPLRPDGSQVGQPKLGGSCGHRLTHTSVAELNNRTVMGSQCAAKPAEFPSAQASEHVEFPLVA